MTIIRILTFTTIALLSTGALAGLYQPAPVTIVDEGSSGFADGDMQTARNSKDDAAFIGCGVRVLGGPRIGFCQADDGFGNQVACFTQDPGLLNEFRAINDFSYVQFIWEDDGNGNITCISVGFSTQSFYLDKAKN